MRTLAIDLGTNVGLAMSDEGGRFATPLKVLDISDSSDDPISLILMIVHKEDVQRIVLGLPLNMDDSVGPMAKGVVAWGKNLARHAKLPVVYVDERLSSFEAEQQLIGRKKGGEKISRQQKKARLDALAATHFLQAFLDGKLHSIDPITFE